MTLLESAIPFAVQLVLFPYFLTIAGRSIHPHTFFEALGYATAFAIFLLLRSSRGDAVVYPIRWALLAAAFAGGTLGSKLLFWMEDPHLTMQHLHDPAYLIGGKTIVGGLLGGVFAVEMMKRYIGFRESTGDLLAVPIAAGLSIGRIGCFLTGLTDNTYGTPTTLPWGVDFGDGVHRHPTQVYEIVFLLALIPILLAVQNAIRKPPTNKQRAPTPFRPGDAFKMFMASYLVFRFLCDFIKPYPAVFLGLGTIQLACVFGFLYYFRDVAHWLSPARAGT